MTGWRIGWLIAPKEMVGTLQKLQQNLFICAGSVAQHAGLVALREGDADVEAMRKEYARRRDTLLSGLRALGFPIPAEPMGAYYILPTRGTSPPTRSSSQRKSSRKPTSA